MVIVIVILIMLTIIPCILSCVQKALHKAVSAVFLVHIEKGGITEKYLVSRGHDYALTQIVVLLRLKRPPRFPSPVVSPPHHAHLAMSKQRYVAVPMMAVRVQPHSEPEGHGWLSVFLSIPYKGISSFLMARAEFYSLL